MAKKLIKITVFLIFSPLFGCAQEYRMTDVSINGIKMSTPYLDYNNFFNCKILKQKQEIIEETNMLIDKITYSCDSLLIIYYDIDTKEKRYPFTYYIESFSDKYPIQLRDMKFQAGMTVEEVSLKIPSIKNEYEEYIKENQKNLHQAAYFGISIEVKLNDPEIPFYLARLKFQMLEGQVLSVMVDFRSDGDFN